MKCMPFWKGCNRNIDYIDQRQKCLVKVPDGIERYSKTLEELLLDSNMIRELPKSLFRLEQLRKLTLSDNQLPRIQADFVNLSNLQELDVSKNDLCQVTESIKHLKNLQVIDLSCNPLQDLPISLTMLKNLTSLSINDIAIRKLPQDIGNMSSLEVLEARDNLLSGLPSSIGDLTKLRVLDVGSNSIIALPTSITHLSSLQEMRLDFNELSELPEDIDALKNILELDLSENKIEVLPIKIGGLANLTDLDLSQNLLEDLPDSIGELKSLVILKLDQNRLLELTRSIGNCEALQELILTENLLTELPPSIGKLKNLSILNADKNRLSSLPAKIGGCSRLGVLSLRDNTIWKLPDDIGMLKELHVLDVSGNRLQNLPISLNSCNLKALWLSENQAQPLLKFQQDVDEETGAQVLTCFLLPQQAYTESMENLLKESCNMEDNHKFNEAPRSSVKFAEDVNDDDDDDDDPTHRKESSVNFVRHNTPHPKDLRLRHNKMLDRNVDGHMIPHKGGKNKEGDVVDVGNKKQNGENFSNQGFNDSTANSQFHQLEDDFSNQLQQQQLLLQQQQQLIEQQLSNNAHDDDCRQEVIVRVIKTPGIGLGISIAGGLGSVPYEGTDEGIFVSKVNPTGAAEKCGVIPGDKILSVNNESMVGIEHNRAVELLKAGGNDMLLLLHRKVNNIINTNLNLNNINNNFNAMQNNLNVINNNAMTNMNTNDLINNSLNNNSINNNMMNNIINNNNYIDNNMLQGGVMLDTINCNSLMPQPHNDQNGYLNEQSANKMSNATNNLDKLLKQNLSPIQPLNQAPSSFSSTPLQSFNTQPPFDPSLMPPDNFNASFNQPFSPINYPCNLPTFPYQGVSSEYPIEDITIEKVNGALGLSIVGGVGHTSQPFGTGEAGIYISKITKNGPASKTTLRVGDRLLMVDNTDVTKATHLEVVTLLVVPEHQVTIRVSKDPQPSGFKEITLTKSEGEQLGLTIVGGVGEEGDEQKEEGIFISRILPNSVASNCEHLKPGQRILEVNGHTFLGVSQSEALEVFSHECNNTYNIIICDGLNKHQHNLPLNDHQLQLLPDPQFNTDENDEHHVQHIQNIAYQPSQQIQTQLQQSQQQLQFLLQQQQMAHNISCQALPQPLLQSNSQRAVQGILKNTARVSSSSLPKPPPPPSKQLSPHTSKKSKQSPSTKPPSSSKPPLSSSKTSHTHHRATPANTLTGISLIKKSPINLSPIDISPANVDSCIDQRIFKENLESTCKITSPTLKSFNPSSSPYQSFAASLSPTSPPSSTSLTYRNPLATLNNASKISASTTANSVLSPPTSASSPTSALPPLPPVLQNLLKTPKENFVSKNSSSMDNLLEPSKPSLTTQSPPPKLDRKSSLDASMRPTQYLNKQMTFEEERRLKAEQRKLARLQFLEGASSRMNEQLSRSRDASPFRRLP